MMSVEQITIGAIVFMASTKNSLDLYYKGVLVNNTEVQRGRVVVDMKIYKIILPYLPYVQPMIDFGLDWVSPLYFSYSNVQNSVSIIPGCPINISRLSGHIHTANDIGMMIAIASDKVYMGRNYAYIDISVFWDTLLKRCIHSMTELVQKSRLVEQLSGLKRSLSGMNSEKSKILEDLDLIRLLNMPLRELIELVKKLGGKNIPVTLDHFTHFHYIIVAVKAHVNNLPPPVRPASVPIDADDVVK